MPFKNIRVSQPQMNFQEIDKVVCAQVLPIIVPAIDRYYPILPNGKPSLFTSEAGPMRNQDSRKYLALRCLDVGLLYPEIGLWIDECIAKYTMKHADGITREIRGDKESCLRFDNRKPVYCLGTFSIRYISIR